MKRITLLIFFLFAFANMIIAQNYLCFEVTSGTTIQFSIPSKLQYSFDKSTWSTLTGSGVTATEDCKVYFRGNNPDGLNTGTESGQYGSFSLTKPAKCSGNIMTLINFRGNTTTIPCKYCFYRLFYNCPITTAPELPATKLTEFCYYYMFQNCTRLEKSPILSATTLEDRCYGGMFYGCSNLKCIYFDNKTWGALYTIFYANELISKTYSTSDWVSGVSSTGTFVCPKELSKIYDNSHIPSRWNVKYSEDIYSITIPVSSQPYITIAETTEIESGTEITFSVTDRSADGFTTNVIVKGSTNIETTQSGNDYTFTMPEEDVTIRVSYTPIKYNITTDEYSSAVAEASLGETVNVSFTERDGYTLTSATYNGTELTINDYQSSFTMPAANVEIQTTYEETPNNIDYLCFEVEAGTTISIEKYGDVNPIIKYSYDKIHWFDLESVTTENDCNVYFKGVNPDGISKSTSDYTRFKVSKTFNCSGNIMTLIDGKGESTIIPTNYCFCKLFLECRGMLTVPTLPATTLTEGCYMNIFCRCSALTEAPELPATILTKNCYNAMFADCKKLTKPPILPATTLAEQCYYYMFNSCSNLSIAPKLPATTLAKNCYYGLFVNCTSLINPPKLPATTLVADCYENMFSGCTNLISAPELPATTLTSFCYAGMFRDCINLTIIPKLPATQLAYGCYVCMFENCSKLQNHSELPATNLATRCYDRMFSGCNQIDYLKVNYKSWLLAQEELPTPNWVKDVAQTGTFVCPKDLPLEYGVNRIPEGWQVKFLEDIFDIDIEDNSKPYIIISETTEIVVGSDVTFSVADKTTEGLVATVIVQGTDVLETTQSGNDYTFTMPRENVTISVTYSPIKYSITTDEFSSSDKNEAYAGDNVTITIHDRNGYEFISATYNGTALNVSNKTATFTMPSEKVSIVTTFSPIEYNITASEHVTVDKEKATINDKVSFTVADRTTDGYQLDKVLVNNTEFSITDYTGEIDIKNYLSDLTITVEYSKIEYSIDTDHFTNSDKALANVGDKVNVTFIERPGYDILSAYFTLNIPDYNYNPLTISDYAAWFTMPAANVYVTASYTPAVYNVSCSDNNISIDKYTATIHDIISVTVADRTSQGYQLTKVLANTTEVAITNFTGIINMADYLNDVTITAEYSKIKYTIITDDYATPSKTIANVGDEITVDFATRPGYNLTSATYNDNALTINNNKATFTMPPVAVSIATTYTPINYTINKGDFIDVDKTIATINDKVTITVADRRNDGYQLTKVLANTDEIPITNFKGEIDMKNYLTDVTITAEYSKIGYDITSDNFATPSKTTANVGDEITVDFATRPGYNLTSATYNGNALTITNNKATFTMPAAAVAIATTYTPIDYTITHNQYIITSKETANVGDLISITFVDRNGYFLISAGYNTTLLQVDSSPTLSGGTSSFIMPAENVSIHVTYLPRNYDIGADQYVTTDRNTATLNDIVHISVADRTSQGYKLVRVLANLQEISIKDYAGMIEMSDYLSNIYFRAEYLPIDYAITCSDQNVSVDKTTATINDKISITVTDRTAQGYQVTKVLANTTEVAVTNFKGEIDMKDYLTDVTITADYSKIGYAITSDDYATPSKTTANVGDEITVGFATRPGYNLTSATYNSNALNISNNKATFTMPAANVSIATTYTPIEYNVTVGEYVTANKTKATISDQVSFTVSDRTAAGYQLDKVLINNTEFSGMSFNMADYLTDVTITAVYSKIGYTITSDAYSTPSKTKANVGDEITVTFSKRDGYNLTSATYNGTALTIVDYKSQFTMPDEDVEIKTVYTVVQQQITKPEIITDNNVEITLPENLTENTEVTFTVQQKPGYTAFVYVNGVLTNEYKFVFTGKVEIKVDYKELTVSNISAETESYCAGDEINLTFATNPYAVEYELTFSNEAQKEGFENIDFLPVESYEKQPTSFKIPQSAKPGKYHAFIRVKDSKDSHSKQYAFDFEVLYPTDIIETKYSDLICVNNSKNEYIGYQWFKDNKEIKGADKQFYIDAPMLNGSYSVALILKNGEKIRTCNYIVSNPTLKKSLKPSVNVYPNPAKASAPVVVELSEMDDLTDAYILIYNQLGVQIDKISNLTPHNTLSLKKGFYHGVVICGSTKLTFKIIVNE